MGNDEKSKLLDKHDPNQQGGVGVSWLLVVAVAVAIIIYVTVVTVVFLTKMLLLYAELLHAQQLFVLKKIYKVFNSNYSQTF
jgi:hypothetical protein